MNTKWRHKEYWTAVGVIPRWQLIAVYLLIATVGIVGFWRVGTVADRADRASKTAKRVAIQNAKLTEANRQLTLTIQSQRAAYLFDSCKDQNDRHDDAVATTLRILGHPVVPPRPPLTPAQQAAQRRVIINWVDALVPYRNCQSVVEKATSP